MIARAHTHTTKPARSPATIFGYLPVTVLPATATLSLQGTIGTCFLATATAIALDGGRRHLLLLGDCTGFVRDPLGFTALFLFVDWIWICLFSVHFVLLGVCRLRFGLLNGAFGVSYRVGAFGFSALFLFVDWICLL
jgi:hypothetical protein